MCQFYDVPRSSYYAWKRRETMPSKDLELVSLIEECHKKHKRRYGYRRVKLWLEREKGMKVNHKKVLRITEKYNLLSLCAGAGCTNTGQMEIWYTPISWSVTLGPTGPTRNG